MKSNRGTIKKKGNSWNISWILQQILMELPLYRYILLLRSIVDWKKWRNPVAKKKYHVPRRNRWKKFRDWVGVDSIKKRAPALYYFHSIAPDRFLENATRNWIYSKVGRKSRGYGTAAGSFYPKSELYTYLSVICSYATSNARLFQVISEQRASQILFQDVSPSTEAHSCSTFQWDTHNTQSWRLFSPPRNNGLVSLEPRGRVIPRVNFPSVYLNRLPTTTTHKEERENPARGDEHSSHENL